MNNLVAKHHSKLGAGSGRHKDKRRKARVQEKAAVKATARDWRAAQ